MDEIKSGIAITLNGGKKEMDSATIPVEWWLSEEVINKGPKYIVFFEQNKSEKDDEWESSMRGRRYACKVTDAIKYIQLFSPGYHRLMAVVICGENDEIAYRIAGNYLNRNGMYNVANYIFPLRWSEIENGEHPIDTTAATIEEFEVPEELFAKKPETKLSKIVWWWTNFCHKSTPRDQCQYRRRKIWAFTVQVPIIAACFVILSVITCIHCLYTTLAYLAVLFVGYRPLPLLELLWDAITFKRFPSSKLRRFDRWDTERKSIYKLWSIKNGKAVYMPVTPLMVVMCTLTTLTFLAGLYLFLSIIGIKSWIWLLIILAVIAIISAIIVRIETAPELKEKRKKKSEEIIRKRISARKVLQEKQRKWLLENFELSKKTDTVRLDQLPVPQTATGKIVQKFKVSYWALKARVCKPFAK